MTALGLVLLLGALGVLAWSSVRREHEVDPEGAPGARRGRGDGAGQPGLRPRRRWPGLGAWRGRTELLGVLVLAAGAVAATRLLSVLV